MNKGELDVTPGLASSGPGWSDVPVPVVVVDHGGTVSEVSPAGRDLLPEVAVGSALVEGVPAWFWDAHLRVSAGQDVADVATGPLGERVVTAYPVRHAGGVAWWLADSTAQEHLRLERRRTEFLTAASSALLASLNPDRCMEMTAELATTYLADAALVITPGHQGTHTMVSCSRGERPVRDRRVIDPEVVPGLGEALRGFPTVPPRWIEPSGAPEWLVPPGVGAVGSLVVLPLPGHGAPAGALVLRRRQLAAFSEDEQLCARLFAARAGAALAAAHVHAEQAAITEVLMRDLLPPPLREVGGIEFAGRYRAALDTDQVGGDFYDVHPVDDERAETLAVLGDVCGKGLEAAVLTGKIRTTLRALLPEADDHGRLLTLLNDALLSSGNTRFATLVLASAVRDGTSVRLRLTAAGHPPPMVVRASGEVEEVDTSGMLVGLVPTVRSRTATVTLAPGETCLLYTDGITEARGGPFGAEVFGEERLREALAECGGLPGEAIVERIHMLATQWAGNRVHDDVALLAITAARSQHLSAVGGHGPGRFTR